MQKYCLNKSVRIVELEDNCFIYDCDKFVEYKLNGVALMLFKMILNNRTVEKKYTFFLSQLVSLGIIYTFNDSSQ